MIKRKVVRSGTTLCNNQQTKFLVIHSQSHSVNPSRVSTPSRLSRLCSPSRRGNKVYLTDSCPCCLCQNIRWQLRLETCERYLSGQALLCCQTCHCYHPGPNYLSSAVFRSTKRFFQKNSELCFKHRTQFLKRPST